MGAVFGTGFNAEHHLGTTAPLGEPLVPSRLAGSVDWLSTGGGASLELMEGRKLPGVEALLDRSAVGSPQAAGGREAGPDA